MKILQKLAEEAGVAAAAKARLVSKAWSAAFTEISVDVTYDDKCGLLSLIRLLPKTHRLQYNITRTDGCSMPHLFLRGFTWLTKLELRNPGKRRASEDDYENVLLPMVNLACLPKTLSHLELIGVTIKPESMTNLQCTGLRHLTCKSSEYDREILNLLPCLTALEVSPASPLSAKKLLFALTTKLT